MAYSDYGGYAYRNGIRIEERSDCTIKPDGDIFGTPGSWPGFALMASGIPADEVKTLIKMPHGHAVLGDGPIYVMLYKQSTLRIFRRGEELEICDFVDPVCGAKVEEFEWGGVKHRGIDVDQFKSSEEVCVFLVDGWRVEVYWRIEDNHYQYVKVVQPNGVVWTGWSGYGVGAGLEDCGYGFSTADRESNMEYLFP